MTVAILKEITAAEAQAEQVEAQAVQGAREIIAAAKRDAADMKTKALEAAEKDARAMIGASEEKAFQDINGIRSRIEDQCDVIRKDSGNKLNKAVDFIVGRIVKP